MGKEKEGTMEALERVIKNHDPKKEMLMCIRYDMDEGEIHVLHTHNEDLWAFILSASIQQRGDNPLCAIILSAVAFADHESGGRLVKAVKMVQEKIKD